MNWARGDFATSVLSNGNILAVGGENNYKQPSTIAMNQVAQPWVEEYVTELDIWVPKAVLSQPRFRYIDLVDVMVWITTQNCVSAGHDDDWPMLWYGMVHR